MKQRNDFEDISDGYKTISASFLTRQGYFDGDYEGTLIWTMNENPVDFVKIVSHTLDTDEPCISVSYSVSNPETEEKTPYDYKIYLVKIPSLLKPGKFFFYFTCPLTSKRTSLLYKHADNMFLHKEAYKMFAGNPLMSKDVPGTDLRFGLELENKISKLREKLKDKLKSNQKKVPLKLIERLKDLESRVEKLYLE